MSRRKMTRRGGLVYSTERGEMCPTCGYPKTDCKCSSKVSAAASPTGGAVRVWRQTKGRKGKGVTQVKGLPLGGAELVDLAGRLKKLCGSGGTVKDGVIEVQGDHRDKVVDFLVKQGFQAKKAGG